LVAEKKLAEVEAKLRGIEHKLAEVKSLTLTQADEIADLKSALDASEERGYNLRFINAKNFVEPVVHQARKSWVWRRVAGSFTGDGGSGGFPTEES